MNIELLIKIKTYLDYNKESGLFTWKVPRNRAVVAGDVAGTYCRGYIQIKVLGKVYRAHRLAWLFVYGYLPNKDIDHINGNKADNKISNLREVTHIQNCGNQTKVRSKSGFLGVCRHSGGFTATIQQDGKKKYLGFYKSAEEASIAYQEAKNAYLSRF